MSAELRNKFLKDNETKTVCAGNNQNFSRSYVEWLESRVKALEENARMEEKINRMAEKQNTMLDGMLTDLKELDGKIVDAVNDNIDALLETEPTERKVCRWKWTHVPQTWADRDYVTECGDRYLLHYGDAFLPDKCHRCGLPIEEVKE